MRLKVVCAEDWVLSVCESTRGDAVGDVCGGGGVCGGGCDGATGINGQGADGG